MTRPIHLALVFFVLLSTLLTPPVMATARTSTCAPDDYQDSGAIYRICMPEQGQWNRDLVVFAHGYVAFNAPLEIPEDQMKLPGGITMPEIANQLGFAFATTSYRTNGLAIREGIEDLVDLVRIFTDTYGQPRHVYLVGGSEGGIITALAVERFPEVFDGGLAACGPVGDFRRQVNYWGDFRVLFDYFFPGIIDGSPIEVPQEVIDNWDSVYVPRIREAIDSDPHAVEQLLRVAHAPIDRHNPSSVEETILGLLWYNVFATNDGIAKLGGQPFDNTRRLYLGSDNDWRLNLWVQRFQADPAALEEIEAHYQTSGRLTSPLVTLHNTGDPFVPYWHEPLYRMKVFWNGSSLRHSNVPAFRYGHCSFNLVEGVVAFAVLYFKVTGMPLTGVEDVLPDAASRAAFSRLARQYGALR